VLSPTIALGAGGPGRFVSPEERFYAGGANTVRGLAQNELGPVVHVLEGPADAADTNLVEGTAVRTSPVGGERLLLASAELRFPLASRISGALFVDAGDIHSRGAGSSLRVTPGAGVRIASPIGPIRLDIGVNLQQIQAGPLYAQRGGDLVEIASSYRPNQSFLDRFRIHFSVGQAF
jgi:outer membrane protein assembly factor BamA